jgi:hypothetical protein
MTRGRNVIEDTEAKALFGFEKPTNPSPAVICEFKKKILLVASMGDVPDMAGQKITIRSGHLLPPFLISWPKWRF